MEILRLLWDPIANAAGLIAGAVATGVGTRVLGRFRTRMLYLRYTTPTQPLAQPGADTKHGKREVLCNGQTASNVSGVSTPTTTPDARRAPTPAACVGGSPGMRHLPRQGLGACKQRRFLHRIRRHPDYQCP